jgi:hypothetical protein
MTTNTNKTEWNFVHKAVCDSQADFHLGPLDPENPNDDIEHFDDETNLEHIAVKLGVFDSLTQARKNGWSGPIPPGFSSRKFQKKQRAVFFINKGQGITC